LLLLLLQVRLQVQRQLAQALFKLSVEFRKEETRFLNKMEQQKGFAAGSSIGLIEDEGHALGASDPGFTESQIQKVCARGLAADGCALMLCEQS
jgi:syntaxin 16